MFSLATAITNAHCGISVGLARRCDIVLAKSHFAGKMLQRFRNILERKTKNIKEEFSPPPPMPHVMFPSSLGSKTRVRKRFSDNYETPLTARTS